ncbi:DUF3500 domain-containing protein [Hymenobacter sp. M29]|uniref:DUF3500 domain-containing protein n=1 Tax=Hymenobacter mellowenesis TaxID=3063995 RepID=A0ABT9A8J9_9BACT|nr:DUF3500 domain-containing protein [Hymenobacter sp. M29]MDO7845732.1 DUF3500 domain-containing protein [Hymenobacter sp. M29]
MKLSICFATAAVLLAIMACQQDADPKSAAGAAHSSAPAPGVAAVPTGTGPTARVVQAANAFMATLSAAQKATLIQEFTASNAARWSNLPAGFVPRLGLKLADLDSIQTKAALAVVQAATGTAANEGFAEIQQLRAADDNLNAAPPGTGFGPGKPGDGPPPGMRRGGGPPGGGPGPGGPPPGMRRGPGGRPPGLGADDYGSGVYFIAFLGTPSATGPWMLQFGGHHLATNITFGKGKVTGATPKFEGVEPLRFTTANAKVLPKGTTYAPMSAEAAAMLAMLKGLTPEQSKQAKLAQSFFDVLLGPGQDGHFPATKVGLPGKQLSRAQQALVMAAMAPWVQDSDDATAATLLAAYQRQLPDTYIAYAGTGSFATNGDYVRIDGPEVWIEFVCQNGVVYHSQIHYHSIWRDHARDYGGNFYGSTRQG